MKNTKKPHAEFNYSEDQIEEFHKCMNDPVYFINNYCYINSYIEGKILFKLRPYQEKIIREFQENRYSIWKASRQEGKSSLLAAYAYWFSVFHENKVTLMISTKHATAAWLLDITKFMYENTPDFMRPGVFYYNRQAIEFDNGSRILAQGLSPCCGRGMAVNLLLIDEMAYAKLADQEEMWYAVIPCLQAGESKLIAASTPNLQKNGALFAKLWKESIEGTSGLKPISVTIDQIPGRDEAWQEKMKSMLGEAQFKNEYLAEFVS